MATVSRGTTYGSTETITNTKLHNLVDLASISEIKNIDCASDMALEDTKLADITTGNKVGGTALHALPSIPSGSGLIPSANIPILGTTMVSLVSIPNESLLPISLSSWVDGSALKNLASTPVDQLVRYNLLVSSLASGAIPLYNGSNNYVGKNPNEVVNYPDQSNSQDATTNSGTLDSFADLDTVTKVITSGSQVIVLARFIYDGGSSSADEQVRIAYGATPTVIETIDISSFDDGIITLMGVVTGINGSTDFKIQGTSSNASFWIATKISIIVLELPQ